MTSEPMNAEQVEACRVHILRELSYGEPGRLGADESLAIIAGYQERLALGDVDHFLRRKRDEYEPRGECWNTVNDVLDALRLHVVTGTPLTAPRPHGGPEASGVGPEPLTEAEELRAELRAANEQLAAVWALVEPWRSADITSLSMKQLVFGLLSIRDRAALAAESSSPTEEKG